MRREDLQTIHSDLYFCTPGLIFPLRELVIFPSTSPFLCSGPSRGSMRCHIISWKLLTSVGFPTDFILVIHEILVRMLKGYMSAP